MIKLNYPQFWQTANLLSYLLWPLSLIYWIAGKIRHLIINPIIFPGTVICVGNITVGGTGKTPLIKYIAQHLSSKKVKFVILVRSYRAELSQCCIVSPDMPADIVGDEALELCSYGTVIATKHFTDGLDLIRMHAPQIILVDDGMQNPRFKKDIQIVTVDTMRGFGNGMLIPAGPMRQCAKSAMGDITVIIGNHENQISIPNIPFTTNASIRAINQTPKSNSEYLAFTGIGNNDKFFYSLREAGYNITEQITYPDHYQYTNQDILYLLSKADKQNLRLITTEKDIVKLANYRDKIEVLQVELVVNNELSKQIDNLLCNKY